MSGLADALWTAIPHERECRAREKSERVREEEGSGCEGGNVVALDKREGGVIRRAG
jgi:hypothetical protein